MRGLLAAALVCVAQITGAQEETALADGALLRGLDKVSGACLLYTSDAADE